MAFVPVESTEVLGKNKKTNIGESVGKQLDFYTIRTLLDITPGAAGSESQNRLNALIQVIGTRSQPIIVNVEPVAEETDPSDLPEADGVSSVFTLKFAIEHQGAWENTTPTLTDSIIGASDFVAGNFSVTYHSSL